MRALDGHIHRVLEGKTVLRATKNGRFLVLEMTTGERFSIAWADANTGEGAPGEPCLVRVDVALQVPGVTISGEARAV